MTSKLPLSERLAISVGRTFDHNVNCFCISEFFFRDTVFRQSTADEMLNFVATNFLQVEDDHANVLTLVWSRSSSQLPIGEFRVQELAKRLSGFPYGLILEHSFVQVDQNFAFQKADPKPVSKIEIVPITQAIQPYTELNGFELTRHIPGVQF